MTVLAMRLFTVFARIGHGMKRKRIFLWRAGPKMPRINAASNIAQMVDD
jgi:hypothetical protein